MLCLLLLLLPTASAVRLPPAARGRISRRAAAAALFAISCTPPPASAGQSQRGAEDPYETVLFGTGSCTSRTPLGACRREDAAPSQPAGAVSGPPRLLPPPAEEEKSALISSLLEKSAANAEKNARLVKETTLKNALGGTFGPFAKDAPIMKADGTFDIVPLARYDRLKDAGKITQSVGGLDMYVSGFDPSTFQEKRGLFGF
ncbi:hypothetical protein AB1Y20_015793 [Prymnesium parvum]|uniref:PS II complex 12 kDa extrinsic protein n=1 Tax=Prymnesium parvum TaxID=97485 RepID=A0AB34K211_PRYPA